MNEFEIISLEYSFLINNSIFQIGAWVGILISFFAALKVNKSGASRIAKAAISIFSVLWVLLSLGVAAFRNFGVQIAHIRIAELRDSGVKITNSTAQLLKDSGMKSTDVAQINLFGDFQSVIFNLLLLILIITVTWAPGEGNKI